MVTLANLRINIELQISILIRCTSELVLIFKQQIMVIFSILNIVVLTTYNYFGKRK